jgi:DNA invertase Pin-like site-specific DNA recombinase
MRVGIYARVSTLIGQSPEMQLAELREYAARRGWEVYAEYVDSGVSGSKESRPELNRLMSDVHLRRFDVVLCWKVDRFGRSLKHLVNALADLDSYGDSSMFRTDQDRSSSLKSFSQREGENHTCKITCNNHVLAVSQNRA